MAEDNSQTLWPGWETVRVIGRGSFGTVYEIKRDVFGQKEKAALKFITIPQNSSDIEELRSDGYDDASITDTFKSYLKNIVDEYSLMRKLNGTANVVNCDDVRYVQHDDGYGWDIYIKMELVTPLTKALGKTVSDEQVIKIGKDICEALILCKKHNIVHRDIKPANIFVSKNGDYKLGDFGIAKTVEKTSGGTKIGTYEYMAPEVYHDEKYGSSADIYSLGLVLYWLLNERRTPFLPLPPQLPTSSDKDVARKKRFGGETIPGPAHGSKELQQIVLKACAYKPKDRFLSANDFLRALNKIGNEDSTTTGDRLGTENDETVDDGTGTKKVFNTENNEEEIKRERTESETVGESSGEEGTGTVDIFNAGKKIENDNNNSVVPPPPPPKKNWLVIGAIGCIIAIFAWMILWRSTPQPVKFPSPAISTPPPTTVPTRMPTSKPTPTYTPTPVVTSIATPMPVLQPTTLYGKKAYDYYHGGTSPTFPEIIDYITQSYQSRLDSNGAEAKGPTSQGYSATGYMDNKYGFYYADGLLYFAEVRSNGITDVGLYYWDKKLIAVYDMSGTGKMFVEGDYVFERVRDDYQKLYDIAMSLEKVK